MKNATMPNRPRAASRRAPLRAGCEILSLLGGVLLGASLAGCVTPQAPLPAWRQAVERYVADHNDDWLALVDPPRTPPALVDRPALATFNRLAVPAGGWPPGQTNDVFGALLGPVPRADGVWLVYVVAIVHRDPPSAADPTPDGRFDDLRIVAARAGGPTPTWATTSAEPHLLARYVNARTPADCYARPLFPAPGDRFVIGLSADNPKPAPDTALVVREERSGACWQLNFTTPTDSQSR